MIKTAHVVGLVDFISPYSVISGYIRKLNFSGENSDSKVNIVQLLLIAPSGGRIGHQPAFVHRHSSAVIVLSLWSDFIS